MRALVQKVTQVSVTVGVHEGDEGVGRIGQGLVALVGVTHDDVVQRARRLASKPSHSTR